MRFGVVMAFGKSKGKNGYGRVDTVRRATNQIAAPKSPAAQPYFNRVRTSSADVEANPPTKPTTRAITGIKRMVLLIAAL